MILIGQVIPFLKMRWRLILAVVILNIFFFIIFKEVDDGYIVFLINVIFPLSQRTEENTKQAFIWITAFLLVFGLISNWIECIFSLKKSIVYLLMLFIFLIHFKDVIHEKAKKG